MKFSDVSIGVTVALIESMDDGFNNHEIRCTYYEARDGEPKFSPKFRCAYRVRTIQGDPNNEDERLAARFDTKSHRTETEVPGALPVTLADQSPWGHLL